MLLPATERKSHSQAFDVVPPMQAVDIFLQTQRDAVASVMPASGEIVRGAEMMAGALRAGRSIVYAAAGSSGLMALADACELPGTFGVPAEAIHIYMPGGVPSDGNMPGDTEDDTEAALAATRGLQSRDVAIVLSASGTTPYALAVAEAARLKGALVIAIANNPDTALLVLGDVAICLETPPEIIAGSTRLAAGTAQKIALNLMSSLMGAMLGHVYQGLMVNVVADNKKLAKRATGIVSKIAGVPMSQAETALECAGGQVKPAVLIAAGCAGGEAIALLAKYDGHLGPSLQSLRKKQNKNA